MRTLADPELNAMAKELKTMVWVDPLDFGEEELCRQMTFDKAGLNPGDCNFSSRKCVAALPGCDNWAVRLYLGGGQRTLGLVTMEGVSSAFRFSDMARQYFWKYKVRAAAPPADRELNLTRERLEADMVVETVALDLLRRQEEYMLRVGILKTSAQRAAEEKETRAARKKGLLRRTVQLNHLEVMEKLNALGDQIEECVNTLTGMIGRMALAEQLEDCVNTLTARIDQQDASLGKVLTKVIQDLNDLKTPHLPGPIYTSQPPPGPGYVPPFSTGDPMPPNPITIS